MEKDFISVKNLRKSFDGLEVLKGINLSIQKGEMVGIIGLSGAGKSTLVRCLNRLESWDEGQIYIDGEDMGSMTEKELNRKRQKIGMIFQQFNLLSSKNVYENIALPLRYLKKSKEEIDSRVNELLEIVGLTDKIDAYPSQLSGGQKQRVAIARALANNPEILLSDEATSALDPNTTAAILQLLKKLNRELGLTIVVITHEMEVVREICNRVAVIDKGIILEEGNTYDVFAHPQNELTKHFISSILKTNAGEDLLEKPEIRQLMGEDGILLRIPVQEGEENEFVISIARRFQVSVHIVYGSVGLVENRSIGNLYVVINGVKENVSQVVRWVELKNQDLTNQIQVITDNINGGDV